MMYLSLDQHYASSVALQVRSSAPAAPALQSVRDTVRALDPELPLFDVRSFAEHMETAVFVQRIGANLLAVMGGLALVLAVVGLYGVIAYAVSQRTREIGIRLALGARPADVLTLVLRQGSTLVVGGAILGIALSLAGAGLLGSLLPGISPRDPLTFGSVTLLLLAVAAVAVLVPGRRAARTDPTLALRA